MLLIGGYVTIGLLMSIIIHGEILGYWNWDFWGIIIVIFFILYGAPIICLLIYRAVSREREFLADADAVLLTRNPAGLARALAKLNVADNAKMQVNAATANLYFVNPLPGGYRFWDSLLSSHPPVEERIDMLGRMGGVTSAMLQRAEEAGRTFYKTVSVARDLFPEKQLRFTKQFSLKRFLKRVLAFWFGLGLLKVSISSLYIVLRPTTPSKHGIDISDILLWLLCFLIGVYLLIYGVGGPERAEKITSFLYKRED